MSEKEEATWKVIPNMNIFDMLVELKQNATIAGEYISFHPMVPLYTKMNMDERSCLLHCMQTLS